MRQKTRRFLAFLLAFLLAFSDASFVRATEGEQGGSEEMATVYRIYGRLMQMPYGGYEPDPESLVIADACPEGEGMMLVAKFITDGKYVPKLSVEDPTDAEVRLLMNNVTIDLRGTGHDRIRRYWSWFLAGDSKVLFDNMTASTTNDPVEELDYFPAYTGEVTVEGLLGFYGVYPFEPIWDENDQLVKARKEARYDVTGYREVDGEIFAGRVVVNEGANLVMNAIEDGENQPTRGGQIQATQIEIDGTVTMNQPTQADAPPQIRVYADGSITLGTNGSINACDGTELILHDRATVAGALASKLCERNIYNALVPYGLSADHGCETFVYSSSDGKWILAADVNEEDDDDFRDNTYKVNYFQMGGDEEEGGKVYVNGQFVEPDNVGRYDFAVNQNLNFTLDMPERRRDCTPIIEVWTAGDEYYCSDATKVDAQHLISLAADKSFTFKPAAKDGFKLQVHWSDYEYYWYKEGEFLIQTDYWNNGSVSLSKAPKGSKDAPNEETSKKSLYDNSVLESADGLRVAIAPSQGRHLESVWLNVSSEYGGPNVDVNYVNRQTYWEGEEYLYAQGSGFSVENGTIYYTIPKSFKNCFIYFGISFRDDFRGIEVNSHGGLVEVRFGDNESFIALSGNVLSRSEYENKNEVQLRIQAPSNEEIKGLEVIAREDAVDDVCQLLPYPADGILRLQKEGQFWKNYEINVITWDTALDGQYRFEKSGDAEITISGGNKQFDVNYDLTPGQPISFTLSATPYKVIACPNWEGWTELEKTGGQYQYVPESNAALIIRIFMTENDLIEFNKPKFRVEFDERWDGETNAPTAFVSEATYGNMSRGQEYGYDVDDLLVFTLTPPSDRIGCTPIVEIQMNDGEWFSSQTQDTDHKIKISKNKFSFPPSSVEELSDRGFTVNIWWSDYDKLGPNWEENEIGVEMRGDGGTVTSNLTAIATMNEPNNGGGVKKIVKRDSLTNDSLQFTFTPDSGRRFQNLSVWIGDQETKYTTRKNDNPDEWICIDGNENFALVNGVYVFTIPNVSQIPADYISVNAWFEDKANDWIQDGQYYLNYDENGEENGEPNAKVYVNNSLMRRGDNRNTQSFTVGTPLTFRLQPNREREGCQAIVEINTNLGDHYSSVQGETDEAHRIILSDQNTFTFKPLTADGFEVRIWWSDYDRFGRGDKEFLLNLNCWNDGRIEPSKEVANNKRMNEPNQCGGVKRIYANSVLDSADGLKVTITPNDGYYVSKVCYDLGGDGGHEHAEYVNWTPGNGETYLFAEGSGFTENNGVVTYVVPKKVQGRDLNLNAEFERAPTGIVINANGGSVQYRLGTSGSFKNLSGDTLERSVFESASVVQLRLTPEYGKEFKGVNYVCRERGKDDVVKVIQPGTPDVLTTDGLLTLNRGGNTWPSIEVEIITWDVTYDGQYRIDQRGEGELHVSGNLELGRNYDFTVNQPITFSFAEPVYKVRVCPNWRESFDLDPVNGVYSYTPTEDRALKFDVFMNQEEYEFEMFQPDHNTNEFSVNYGLGVDEDVVVGSAPIITYGNVTPKDSRTLGNQTRLILENVTMLPFVINVPAGADYRIHVDGRNDDEVTAEVKANNNVLELDVSEPWNIPYVDIHVFKKQSLHDPELVISKKSLTLYDTIAIDFKVAKSAIEGKYHDPYLVVTQNGADSRISEYSEADGLLIFTFRVAPHQMGDEVTAVPHALDANGDDVAGVAMEYSVKDYCQNMLGNEKYQTNDYVNLRRLLVDILIYGEAAQVYVNYKTDNLV
ncbi:MAG: hypothetical protein IK081_11815, partial [Lachnospiraceae bacterium]|nr:hypothetical protein [Lachnospiraceae bacterium]